MQRSVLTVAICLLAGSGCVVEATDDDVGSNTGPGFEQFVAETYHEPWEGGVYIVNGDRPIESDKKLREFYEAVYGPDPLIVHQAGGRDSRWNDTEKKNLTYCVSDEFGGRKDQVVQAMRAASDDGWEQVADVDFTHVASEDGNCNRNNGNVVFDVRPVSGAPYAARAFFPHQARWSRNVLIDSSAYGGSIPLANILAHELGHALGFRHEHTRPEAGSCYEDSSWRPLTDYDSSSVMHYPQCNGTGRLQITQTDVEGARALYGAPGDDPGQEDPGQEPPQEGNPRSGSGSGTLSAGEEDRYQPLAVVSGSRVEVTMVGAGDADLYLRFDESPSVYAYDCRPYRQDSNERCSLDVPAGASHVYIMVRGYREASYEFEASWLEP